MNSSYGYHINHHFDHILWAMTINEAIANGKLEPSLDLYHTSLDEIKERFPEEYNKVLTQPVFTFEHLKDSFERGIQLHAYICRTNQERYYVCMSEEEYKGSKYEKMFEEKLGDGGGIDNIEKDRYKIIDKI